MNIPTTYVLGALIALISFAIISRIRNSVDEKSIIATPSIPLDRAVVTASSGTTRIKASVGDVFDFISKFKDPGQNLLFTRFKWEDVDDNGVPLPGSIGKYYMEVDSLGNRLIGVQLNVLDRENFKISEVTTNYHSWLLRAERVQEVSPVPNQPGVCDYRTYMTAQGIAAYYILLTTREEIVEGSREYAESLRMHFLSIAKASKSSRT